MTKRLAVPRDLMMRHVNGRSLEERFYKWVANLRAERSARTKALDLYKAQHWSVVKSIADSPATAHVRIWIISAGHGLISPETNVPSYASTFAPHHADSVSRSFRKSHSDCCRTWWKLLTEKRHKNGGCYTIADVIRRQADAAHVLALSPDYLDAVSEDLANGANALNDPEDLIIVSADRKGLGPLQDSLIPTDARLQRFLGGARVSLNVRIARLLLEKREPEFITRKNIRKWMNRLVSRHGDEVVYNRRSVTDGFVMRFIAKRIGEDPSAPYTRLLRELRNANYACEMRRFAALFTAARDREYAQD